MIWGTIVDNISSPFFVVVVELWILKKAVFASLPLAKLRMAKRIDTVDNICFSKHQ